MLSIEEIKLTIDTLKKLKDKDFKKFIDHYLKQLESLALQIDAYNDDQIAQLDKTRDWFQKDLDWRKARRDSVYDDLLTMAVQNKIYQFSKSGAGSNSLEIGPGTGRFSRLFLAWRLNFFVDVLPRCEVALKKLFNPKHYKYLRFYTTDRTSCSHIPTNSCNFVFSWDTFTFFTQAHIEEYLKDIHRVILPGGYCLIHYADCHYEKDLHEAKRGYWNFNTKTAMKKIIEKTGYTVIEMAQIRPGANYAVFQKPGKDNPVLYKVLEIPVEK